MSLAKWIEGTCALSLCSAAVACSSVSEDGTRWIGEEPVGTVTEAAAVSGVNKICSGITPSNWRDTILVPPAWTRTTCQQWTASTGAPQYQLGCIWDGGFSWGPVNGGPPATNNFCSWQ